MSRTCRLLLIASAAILFIVSSSLLAPSLAQDWESHRLRGTIRVVDLFTPSVSAMLNCVEGLVSVDRDNQFVPCLARDWRWVNERTIEFKLRRGVTFHNGEDFNAEAVRINWEAYKSLNDPRVVSLLNLPDETMFAMVDKYIVRFILPEPDGLALARFAWFFQAAPGFFNDHKVDEKTWLYFPEPGPWGTGPFRLVEGRALYGRPSGKIVLEAYEDYWDPQYPKVHKAIFDNSLTGDRDEAMRLCVAESGAVDIVSHIRPLDTIRVAESSEAKVVKSKDGSLLWGYFNQRKRNSKWTDIRLRKALNYAVNREELMKYAARGNAYNIGGIIPVQSAGHSLGQIPYTYDTEKARSLLAEAGYPDGFEMRVIAWEAWRLEGQIISRMLERIGLKVKLQIVSYAEYMRRTYIPLLEKAIEEQEWDLVIGSWGDVFGHFGVSFLAMTLIEDSDWRWIKYDPVYEAMWKDMAEESNVEKQAEKMRKMAQYLYSNAYFLFIYSPITLYAVNKDVNFMPQKSLWLRLKETSVTENHLSVRGQSD